jgi:hypothetical protein
MDQIMEVIHTERKCPKLNKLEKFCIYEITKMGLQMNNTFMDMYNTIFETLKKYYIH